VNGYARSVEQRLSKYMARRMGPCVWQFCHDGVGGKPLGPWRMTP
jgi:hypothetical protein